MNLKNESILLINPNPTRYDLIYQSNELVEKYFQTREQIGSELGDQRIEPNNGLLSIGGELLKLGYKVRYLDLNAIETKQFENERRYLTSEEIDTLICKNLGSIKTVLLSSLTCSFGVCGKIAKIVKRLNGEIKIILGGIFPTLNENYCVEKGENFDAIVLGEGEQIVPKIIQYFLKGSDASLENQEGFALKKNGRFYRVPGHNIISDLNSLASPAFELLDPDFTPVFRVFTARGCSYRCSFCAPSFMGKHKVRTFSSKKIIETLRQVKELSDNNFFLIGDLTFLDNLRHSRRILEDIISADLKMNFWCQTRLDKITEENLKLLKRAGCVQIAIGLESYNSNSLKMASKGINVSDMVKKLSLAKQFDFQIQGYFIVGLPWEKEENIERTIRFIEYSIERGYLDLTHISIYVPYPGLPLTEDIDLVDKNYDHYYQGVFLDMPPRPVYKTDHLSPDRILWLWKNLLKRSSASFEKRIANNHQQVRDLKDGKVTSDELILGADALTIAGEIAQEAKVGKKKSVFNIVQGINPDRNPYVSKAIVGDENYVVGFAEIYEEKEVSLLIEVIDGVLDIIHFDIDKKSNRSKETVRASLSKIKRSKLYTYSDLETLFKSILYIVQDEKGRDPNAVEIVLIHFNKYSKRLANYLIQFGYSVNFYASGELTGEDLRYQHLHYPELPTARPIIINYSLDSRPISPGLIDTLKESSMIIDVSPNGLNKDICNKCKNRKIILKRPDTKSMVLSEVYLSEHYYKEMAKDSKGKGFIDGYCLVSGGLIGDDGDIVVNNVDDVKKVYGVADGRGRIKHHDLLTTKDRERLSSAIETFEGNISH